MRPARLTVMSSAFDTAPQLSDGELEDMLALAAEARRVDVRATVPEDERHATAAALGVELSEARIGRAYFFDTPDLLLFHAGIVACARRTPGRSPASAITLRPVATSELPDHVRHSKRFVVEVDAMPGAYVCSGTLRGAPEERIVEDVLAQERPLRKLFSKRQRALFAARAPAGVELDDLAVLGPIEVAKLEFRPGELDRRLRLELWSYPDGSRVVELTARCSPARAVRTITDLRDFLAGRGIGVSAVHQTKALTALEQLAARLTAA